MNTDSELVMNMLLLFLNDTSTMFTFVVSITATLIESDFTISVNVYASL